MTYSELMRSAEGLTGSVVEKIFNLHETSKADRMRFYVEAKMSRPNIMGGIYNGNDLADFLGY